MGVEQILGVLPIGWEYKTLGEVCQEGGGNIQTGPFGSQLHAADYVDDGIPSIMPANIGDNRIVADGIAKINTKDALRLSKYLVREYDIVYSRRGDVERRALIRREQDGWLCGTGCLRVRPGKSGPDPYYLAYYLGHISVREWIVRHAHGATMANLNTSILSDCPFVLPPLSVQRAIASILGSLDDKIDCNRRMNETLEAMARAIFKDWFVDFGPTRAKMEGREPYLAQEVWALFPDRLDAEGKPEGWDYVPLDHYTAIQNGYAFKSTDWIENGVPVVKIGSVKPCFVDLNAVSYISEQLASERANFRLKIGDMLVGLTGYVGEIGRVPPTSCPPLLNQRVGRFVPKSNTNFCPFVYTCVRDNVFKSFAILKAHGSAQPNVSTSDLLQYPVTNPGVPLFEKYNAITSHLFARMLANAGENSTLGNIRDLLLPKLMSGEIRLREAEKIAGEAS